MEISSEFRPCFLRWEIKKNIIFLCGPLRWEGAEGKILSAEIYKGVPKHFDDVLLFYCL